MSQTIAILGANSNKAFELLSLLKERDFPVTNVYALSKDEHLGHSVSFGDTSLSVQDAAKFDFKGVSLVFACGTAKESKEFLPKAAKAGAFCIDLTPAFRMEPDVPLLIPEVNPTSLKDMKRNIVASPCSISTMLALAIKPLHENAVVKRIVVSTYQSTSGAGREAMDELFSQTKALFMNTTPEPNIFSKQIAYNIIPQIDEFMDDNSTREEWMIVTELKKIVSPRIKIAATCVRVPTFVGHSAAVNVEFEGEISPIEASKILSTSPGLGVLDDPEEYITPEETMGEDLVFVSRIRSDISVENGILFWITGDNMRKATSLNAVQIAELWIGKNN